MKQLQLSRFIILSWSQNLVHLKAPSVFKTLHQHWMQYGDCQHVGKYLGQPDCGYLLYSVLSPIWWRETESMVKDISASVCLRLARRIP